MIRKSALAATVAALLTPAVAGALGLGNIEVSSALNEPLQARIPLRGADAGELEELRAALASHEQFQRAGLDRAIVLTRLRFEVQETGGGSGFIRVTSRDPIAEPFLNFLVDVRWPRGRVLREYTVLLDPPVYGAAISSGTGQRVRTVPAMPEPSATPSLAAAPAPVPPAVAAAPPRYTGDSYGPVRRGETLWSIADRVRPAGVSIQNMMLALLRANSQAFIIDNVNALRTGAVLRIPSASEVQGDKAQALSEVARQHALWEEYRQSLTGTVRAQPGGAAPSTAAAPSAAAGATAAPGGEDARLKLVGAGTAGAGGTSAAEVQSLRNELTLAQEEADAAKRENEELKSRLSDVETLVGDLKRLVELKEDQLAALQNQLAQATPAPATPQPPAPQAPPSPAPQAAPPAQQPPAQPTPPPVQAAPPAPRPAPPPPPPPPPASFLDEVNAMLPVPLWTVLAGLGALLVGVGGLRFARSRKAKAAAAGTAAAAAAAPAVAAGEEESFLDQIERTELPEAEDEDVTDLPGGIAPDVATLITDAEDETELPGRGAAGEEDPLAEVNVYLAYERFDQAEQLVRDAIENQPERPDYRLKLLEVFYAAKNVPGFETAAQDLQQLVGDDHENMEQAREWWQDLATGRELFAADDGPATSAQAPGGAVADDELFDVTASDAGDQTGVDFDLGFEGDAAAASAAGSGLDFDLGADDGSADEKGSDLDFDLGSLAEAGEAGEDARTGLDFDLSAGEEGAAQAPEDGDTGLDFDLGDLDSVPESADDGVQGSSVPERIGGDDGADLDFDLGALDDGETQELSRPDSQPPGAASLDFTLDDTGGDSARPGQPERDEAGAESGLDFDLGDTGTLEDAAGAGTESALDLDLGETLESGLDAGEGDVEPSDSEAEMPLDFDLGDTAGEQAASGEAEMDLTLDDGSGEGSLEDPRTGLGDTSDLDLTLDDGSFDGDAGTPEQDRDEDAFPDLDMGDDAESPAIDTVQLNPDQAGSIRGEEDEDDSQFGVDTEFRDIFAAGDGDGGGATDSASSVDFDLGTDLEGVDEDAGDDLESTQTSLRDLSEPDVPADDEDDHTLALGRGTGDVDEMQTKLDLAQAYMDMGDTEGARNLLGEVMAEGDDGQKAQAREMLTRLA